MSSLKTKLFLIYVFIFGADQAYATATDDSKMEAWIAKQQAKHYYFIKNFKTRNYICNVTESINFIYDIKSKKWKKEFNRNRFEEKEIYKIIKSDDITAPISLCEESDKPLSYKSRLNKYFCIINTSQHRNFETHYKCLLNIDGASKGDEDIHTLVCGDGGFKFNLNYGKIFRNNFSIGPYSGYEHTLEQGMEVSDCLRF